MKDNVLNNKLLEIEDISNNLIELRDRLINYSYNKEKLIRSDSIDALNKLISFDIDTLINDLLSNTDDLTRISTIELISTINKKKYLKNIIELLKDKDPLVRAYVYESIGTMQAKKYLPLLLKKLKKVKTDIERVRIFYSLIKLGENKYFTNLESLLYSKDYEVRSATANFLCILVTKENESRILKKLKKVLKNEKTVAVKSTLESIINDLLKEEK